MLKQDSCCSPHSTCLFGVEVRSHPQKARPVEQLKRTQCGLFDQRLNAVAWLDCRCRRSSSECSNPRPFACGEGVPFVNRRFSSAAAESKASFVKAAAAMDLVGTSPSQRARLDPRVNCQLDLSAASGAWRELLAGHHAAKFNSELRQNRPSGWQEGAMRQRLAPGPWGDVRVHQVMQSLTPQMTAANAANTIGQTARSASRE